MSIRLALMACLSAAVVSFAQQPKVPTGTAVVSGRVIDGVTGRPLRGIQVVLALVADSSLSIPMASPVYQPVPRFSGVFVAETATNDQGQFNFTKVPAGSHEIIPWRNGGAAPDSRNAYAEPVRWFEVAEGQQLAGVELKYFQPSRISGRVVDEDGTPIAGILIGATTPQAVGGAGPSDDRGRYAFVVPPGNYVISTVQFPQVATSLAPGPTSAFVSTFYPRATSPRDAATIAIKPGEDRTGLDFVLRTRPTFRITGSVTGEHAAQRIGISLVPDEQSDAPETIATSSMTGRGPFGFSGVPAGRYKLRALSPPNMPIGSHGNPPLEKLPAEPTLWAEVPLTVTDRDLQVTVSLQPGARIHGRIEFEGQTPKPPLDGSMRFGINVERADGRRSDFRGAYTADGQFSTIQVEPGQYVLYAAPLKGWRLKSILRNGRDIRDVAFEIGAEDLRDVVVTFTDQGSVISGRVLRQPPFETTRGWVTIVPSDRSLWSNYGTAPRRIVFVELGRSGLFEAEVPPGTYLVAATDRLIRERLSVDTLTRLAANATPIVVGERQTARVELPLRSLQR